MTHPDPLAAAADRLPSGLFLMTAAHDTRAGAIIRWAQRCAEEPVLVAVALPKGHTIAPVIRDSRAFGLCEVRPDDKLLLAKFSKPEPPDEQEDPFASLRVRTLKTGAPLLAGSTLALDCEVVRHFDLEADHEIYIGQVVAALGG
ncbi:MAG: flavin reductase family protein [Phycisphaerales bacterium JB039]